MNHIFYALTARELMDKHPEAKLLNPQALSTEISLKQVLLC